VETYRALTEGEADIIFNTALTGDGKSLAGQLPALVRGWRHPTLVMYPTNELIGDQQSQLGKVSREWGVAVQHEQLNSARLDEILAEGDYVRRGDALMGILRGNDIVLTNPDIFHLVMHQFYVQRGDAPDRIVGPLTNRVAQLTFDEFHIFGVPQVTSVLNALLFMREISGGMRRQRVLFLSATPDEITMELLRRSGLSVQQVRGEYLHTDATPPPELWRRILAETTLNVVPCRVEEWVEAHVDDTLLPFFLERRPAAKGAIIVNSVSAAYRLLHRLQPVFAAHGMRVEPNTGFTSRSRRADSYQADLLIGTSTVDVGIDFQINFLLFESWDAGSFLQRLGRLGRHPGYQRDGRFQPFDDFCAYACVPAWVAEALFAGRDGAPPLLREGAVVDREALSSAVQQAYPPVAGFEAYSRLWGQLQTARVMIGLGHKTIREQYAQARVRLGQRYEAAFGMRVRPAYARYLDLKRTQPALLREAVSFRGGSYFVCAAIDETEAVARPADRFKTADLFFLLANAQLEPLEEEAFYSLAERSSVRRQILERQEPLAFYRVHGWCQEREDYRLFLDRDIREWGTDAFGKAFVARGFKVIADAPGLAALNHRLSRRDLPSLLCLAYQPGELKRRLRLPVLFQVHPFESRDGVTGSVAFGRDALLLEAALQRTRLPCGGGAIVI